ncbi:hypothetical protein B0T11DRAFT_25453 [Plectosphaerella cucumerina]|uniref:Uncharacterized protein n=1 Tax=Plectosphaerella cucumerina TaxID=40658 RepID=A0A8K0X9G4_9PEZI|nr:hypothetical protein B0T11DRAFT_25453 [Plectosphaerella cucumerina]
MHVRCPPSGYLLRDIAMFALFALFEVVLIWSNFLLKALGKHDGKRLPVWSVLTKLATGFGLPRICRHVREAAYRSQTPASAVESTQEPSLPRLGCQSKEATRWTDTSSQTNTAARATNYRQHRTTRTPETDRLLWPQLARGPAAALLRWTSPAIPPPMVVTANGLGIAESPRLDSYEYVRLT